MKHNRWFSLRVSGRDISAGFWAAVIVYGIGFSLSVALGVVEVIGIQFHPLELMTDWLLCLLIALFEEFVFRGVVLGGLLRFRVNRFVALALSAILFGAMHAFNPGLTWLPMLNIVLAGGMLGASFLYTRNLWFAISLHLFWNWIQGPILGYGVSGNSFGDSLVQIRLSGSELLSGGAFGFEGSLICTVLLVGITSSMLYWFERKAPASNA